MHPTCAHQSGECSSNDMSCITKVFYTMLDSRHPFSPDVTHFGDAKLVQRETQQWALKVWEHRVQSIETNQLTKCKPHDEFELSLERLHYPSGLPKQVERTWHRVRCRSLHLQETMWRKQYSETIDPWCRLCDQDHESIEHVMLHCPVVNLMHNMDLDHIDTMEQLFNEIQESRYAIMQVYFCLRQFSLHK